ncbi:MAG: hypothetical protein LBD75_02235 [Candidatus Peribacteria bacterium]|jgi:hypothetical protein|nr:hypothetical protein [Candidatus Peribacteria bacterium]
MELWTVLYTDQLYQKAKTFFLRQGRSDFLRKSPLSLCGRYVIHQAFSQRGFAQFIPEDGNFQCGTYFFSTAHSGNQIFLAIATQKIAIDMEQLVEREKSLLQPPFTSWEAFYVQWCVKECLVKFLSLTFLEEALEQTVIVPEELGEEGMSVVIRYQGTPYTAKVKKEKGYLFAVMV